VIVRPLPSSIDRRPRWPSGDLVTGSDQIARARRFSLDGNRVLDTVGQAATGQGTAAGPDVDWAEAERRGRLAVLSVPALVIALGACRVLLTGDYAGLHGTAARWLLLAVAAAVLALPLASRTMPSLRARQDTAARAQHALRAHVDPGPALRARVDVLARRSVRLGWMGRALPVLPVSVLLQTDWQQPSAPPAAAVLVAAYGALAVWHHRQLAAARRWTAAPAGPPRPLPPVPWWEPWLGGRRLLGLLGAYVLVVVVIVAV
jgi:hypothetical protein